MDGKEANRMRAISDGVYAWMSDHPISAHDAIEDGAKKGIMAWLDANGEGLLREVLPRALEIAEWNQEAAISRAFGDGTTKTSADEPRILCTELDGQQVEGGVMEIPTVKEILELVESQHEPEVVESVKAAIRTWLIWVPESFPGMEPRMRAIAEQWIRQSDLRFKFGKFAGETGGDAA